MPFPTSRPRFALLTPHPAGAGRTLATVAALLLLLAPGGAAAQTLVYSNNFESGSAGPAFSGAGAVETTGGLSAFGFGANHLRNAGQTASVLTLSGLGSHTSMRLTFDLALWDSIDFGDQLVVQADGVTLFAGALGNYFTPSDQCEGPGTRVTDPFTAFSVPNYGFNPGNRDCGRRDAVFNFAHSASSVVFTFAYPVSQGGLDESFGLDNIRVETNATPVTGVVPEPSTWALAAAGLAGVGLMARRRRA